MKQVTSRAEEPLRNAKENDTSDQITEVDFLSNCSALQLILSFLEPSDVLNCMQVNKRINAIIRSNWKRMPRTLVKIIISNESEKKFPISIAVHRWNPKTSKYEEQGKKIQIWDNKVIVPKKGHPNICSKLESLGPHGSRLKRFKCYSVPNSSAAFSSVLSAILSNAVLRYLEVSTRHLFEEDELNTMTRLLLADKLNRHLYKGCSISAMEPAFVGISLQLSDEHVRRLWINSFGLHARGIMSWPFERTSVYITSKTDYWNVETAKTLIEEWRLGKRGLKSIRFDRDDKFDLVTPWKDSWNELCSALSIVPQRILEHPRGYDREFRIRREDGGAYLLVQYNTSTHAIEIAEE